MADAKHKRLYKDSPKMERGENGKMAIKRPTKADAVGAGVEGVEREGVPAHARHSMERMELHGRHQNEHHTHDHGDHGSKEEMHTRHESEMKAMHTRHEKEMKSGSQSGEKAPKSAKAEKEPKGEKTGEAKIEKVKNDKKED